MDEAEQQTAPLHGQTCAILLFEEPGGEIESLSLVEGVLEVNGDAVMLLPVSGGEAVRVPQHLVAGIVPLTEDHRACLADITSTFWLRAFFDGRLSPTSIDLTAVLAQCSGPPPIGSPPL
jgi:hypothetical protein